MLKKGVDNINSKLSQGDVLWIYQNQNEYSQSALARKFGVSQPTIHHIINGRTWAWLTGHTS